jgi:hypothetical protein
MDNENTMYGGGDYDTALPISTIVLNGVFYNVTVAGTLTLKIGPALGNVDLYQGTNVVLTKLRGV